MLLAAIVRGLVPERAVLPLAVVELPGRIMLRAKVTMEGGGAAVARTGAAGQIPPIVKDAVFYAVFGALFILYALIVGGAWRGMLQMSTSIMLAIKDMAPVILDDLSLYSEASPVVLGFLVGFTAPKRASWVQTLVILGLGVVLWLAYLHMQIFFNSDAARLLLDDADLSEEELTAAVQALSTFASSVRNFAGVVVAAVLGLRLNDNVQVFSPAPSGPGDAAIASEAAAVRAEAGAAAKPVDAEAEWAADAAAEAAEAPKVAAVREAAVEAKPKATPVAAKATKTTRRTNGTARRTTPKRTPPKHTPPKRPSAKRTARAPADK